MVKHPPTVQETWIRSLGQEDPLEKEMATHSSTLAWKIPWTEEHSMLQSMESQSWTQLSDFTSLHFVFMNNPFPQESCIRVMHSLDLPRMYMTKPTGIWRRNREMNRRQTMWMCIHLFCPSQEWMDMSVQIHGNWTWGASMNDNFYKMETMTIFICTILKRNFMTLAFVLSCTRNHTKTFTYIISFNTIFFNIYVVVVQ